MKQRDRKRLATMLMIGQGALNVLKPKRRGPYWRAERKAYGNILHRLNHGPSKLKSLLGVAGAGLGAWWVWRQFRGTK